MSESAVEIYVRSSALGGVGIHWRNISNPEQPMEEPVVLKQRVITKDDGKEVTINFLINDTKPSLILARYQNKILLEITGLDAVKERSQRMGRRISEVVLWVGDASPEVEFQLRQLSACALFGFWQHNSNFTTIIRDSIDFEGLDSFEANVEQLYKLYTDAESNLKKLLSDLLPNERKIDPSELVWSTPTEINTDNELYTLVKQISQTALPLPLPETEQPVVVIAELKKEGDEQKIVYKGNIWKKKPEPKLDLQPEPKLDLQPEPKPLLKRLLWIVRRFLVIILLTLLIFLIIPYPVLTPAPMEIPKQSPLNQTNNSPI